MPEIKMRLVRDTVKFGINAERETFIANIRANMALGLPTLRTGKALLVCGGPSAVDHIEEIAAAQRDGWKVWAVNGAHDWLAENGIIPDCAVAADANPVVNEFFRRPQMGCDYHLATQGHPSLARRLADAGFRVTLFHVPLDEEQIRLIEELEKRPTIVAPANTAGLLALFVQHTKAIRRVRLYGMDCSHRPGQDHAYRNVTPVEETDIFFKGKPYKSTLTWANQAESFVRIWRNLFNAGMNVEVVGDSLLRDMWRELCMAEVERAVTEAKEAA